jgi:histidinol-phosphate aminotransferase
MSRSAIAAMTAYTLELRQAETTLNRNESPFDFLPALKEELFRRIAGREWNRYPDFESAALRTAIAREYGLAAENILAGNGSNELLAAAVGTFVAPGTRVIVTRPTFSLYEKLVAVADGVAMPIDFDPRSGWLPLEEMAGAAGPGAVVILCSPNNPTGSVLAPRGIDRLLATGAVVLFDRAYGDFALDELPPLHENLVTFSTFSKAWGLAGLRVGWLAATAATAAEIRKVKLPYSLNIVSEAAAILALENRRLRDAHVALAVAERERVAQEMRRIPGIEAFPSHANFIAFRAAKPLFETLCARGILIREFPSLLRVTVGRPDQNNAFIQALKEIA